MLKIAVCVSGGGTNLQAIIDAIANKTITNAEISVVISNNKNAYALERAKNHHIESICISPKDYETRAEFNADFLRKLDSYEVDLVVLAGFLVVIPEEMIAKYRNRIINIHPSLIPSFCGTGYYGLNSKYYKYLVQKSMKHNFCYIYPSHNDMTQVIIIDDLHKLNPELAEVVKEIILQFNKLQNNQMIVIGTREKYNKFSFDALFTSEDYEKKYILNGLSKEDKQNNINYYLGCKKNINFHRATDDLIIFSNILQTNLKETKTVNNIITKETIISRTFQNPQVINSHLYKERLSSVEAYYNLIESVYFIGSGISYKILVKTFPAEDIEFLIDNRFFKRVSDKIFPFHDHYVKAFFEGKEISNGTISFIKQICSLIDDPDEKYMYYALLIKSNYNTYCQIDKEAHELELYYFNKTANDLTIEECAFIAGVTHSPSQYNPYRENPNTERINTRTKTVLGKMEELKYINDEQYNEAINKVNEGLKFEKGELPTSTIKSYYISAAVEEVVDLVGGIDVYSDKTFNSFHIKNWIVKNI